MWTADSGLLRALQGLGVEKELTWVDRTIARQRKLQHPVEQRKLPPPTAPARAPLWAPAPTPLTPTTFSGALDRLERVLGVTTDVHSTPHVRPSVAKEPATTPHDFLDMSMLRPHQVQLPLSTEPSPPSTSPTIHPTRGSRRSSVPASAEVPRNRARPFGSSVTFSSSPPQLFDTAEAVVDNDAVDTDAVDTGGGFEMDGISAMPSFGQARSDAAGGLSGGDDGCGGGSCRAMHACSRRPLPSPALPSSWTPSQPPSSAPSPHLRAIAERTGWGAVTV